jgi:hypothetical protein
MTDYATLIVKRHDATEAMRAFAEKRDPTFQRR